MINIISVYRVIFICSVIAINDLNVIREIQVNAVKQNIMSTKFYLLFFAG